MVIATDAAPKDVMYKGWDIEYRPKKDQTYPWQASSAKYGVAYEAKTLEQAKKQIDTYIIKFKPHYYVPSPIKQGVCKYCGKGRQSHLCG